MRKLLVIAAAVLFTANMAYAVSKDNCGCGLGTMVFEGQDGLISQVSAITTNGTFGNQTFGITTGTLGCDKPANLAQNAQINKFVAENMDNLAVDIATGNGESLDTLAELIEMPTSKRSEFYSALQNHFDNIYPSPSVTHEYVVQQISVLVKQI